MPGARRLLRLHLLVVLIYGVLAVALTWPLAPHLLTHVPGNGVDDPPLTWNLWWVAHAFLALGTNPFETHLLFYPLGINLAFYTLTLLNGLLSIPLQAAGSLILASNLLLLSSFILGGYGTFLLTLYVLGARGRARPAADRLSQRTLFPAAFAAGLLYAFASSKMAYAALGQWNIASSQWIPFYVLYLLRVGDYPENRRYPLLAALFLLLQAYAELTYASFLLLFTLLWLACQVLVRLRRRSFVGFARLLTSLAIMGLLVVAGLIPILGMMLPDLLAEGNFLAEGSGFADVFSADLAGFLVPTMYHPIFGHLVQRFSFDYSIGQHIYLGYAAIALALVGIGARQRRRSGVPPGAEGRAPPGGAGASTSAPAAPGAALQSVGFWVVSALAFWLLTLGPALRINGHDTGIPLPFALVAQIPFFEGNRYPSRYSVVLVLSVAVLLAFGLAAILERQRQSRSSSLRPPAGLIAFLLVSAVLFEQLSAPLPLSDMRVPAVYRAVVDQMPAGATLLDLPVAWRNGFRVTGTQDPIIMFQQYYQAAHRNPILAGNTSRNPPLKFQYFTEAPLINTILALETGHAQQVDPALVDQDRGLAAAVLRFFDIAAIIVHPAETGPELVSYVESTLPVTRTYEDAETIAYRVNLPPWPERWAATPGDPLGQLSYAEGWGVPTGGVIWAQRRLVRLLVPMNGTAQQISFRAFSLDGNQQLEVELNGNRVQRMPMVAGWRDYQVTLPDEHVHPGLNEIRLRFDETQAAGAAHLSPRAIGNSGIESPVNLVVQSAGLEVGDFGKIYVNGKNLSPNERGYNVVVLDPQSGDVESAATFDTHLQEDASRALAAFLQSVPPGHIVAVAAADEASRLLGQDAVDALHGIGAAGDLRDKFRWGHALVGVQGAAPGTAAEALDWMRPATVVVGEGATEPTLAAALSALTFDASPVP